MIETVEEWNTRLGYCGCCPMPVCPTPTVICEAKHKLLFLSETADDIVYGDDEYLVFIPNFITAWVADTEIGTIYRKVTINTSSETYEYDGPVKENTVSCTATTKTVTSYSYGGGYETETTTTYTLSEPITKGEFFTLIEDGMEADTWTVTSEGSEYYPCSSQRIDQWVEYPSTISDPCSYFQPYSDDFDVPAALRKIRFRFRIPNTHLGSKFTITYDVAQFPYDAEVDPSFISQDNVIVWTGPGTGLSTDPSWLTPFVEIDPPEITAECRIVNIRYTCYTGTKYGVKPQVMGEAFEPPAP
jgi:hypothetical protein